eukprot:gene6866-13914_t
MSQANLRKNCTRKPTFLSTIMDKQKSLCSLAAGRGRRKETVILVSYPRSGNSYLRTLLERNTGIITGSDSRAGRTLSASLLKCGFKGEGIVDDSVWIVKTHYPERLGYLKYKAMRVILLIRNPFDVIESYFHMAMTNTHNKSLSTEAFQSLSLIWDEFLRNEIHVWNNFHKYWIEESSSKNIPIHVIRFEDLMTDREVGDQ